MLRKRSLILCITKNEEKLVLFDSHDHSVKFCREGKYLTQWEVVRECKTDSQVCFQSPSALVSHGESVSVCDTKSDQAIRSISNLKSYKVPLEPLSLLNSLSLKRNYQGRQASNPVSVEHGLKILKQEADLMKGIESKPYFCTGRRFPQGPDQAFTKPSREAFKMLHSSSQKAKSFLSENALHHIAGNICFPSCTTVYVEHSFGEMRTQSHLFPDMHADYASRKPSCNMESVQ